MSDYIKREDAENAIIGRCEESALWKLRHLSSADVIEVRHGHWVCEHYDDYGHDYIREKCSLCGQVGSYNYIYCPYCGARMDGKE